MKEGNKKANTKNVTTPRPNIESAPQLPKTTNKHLKYKLIWNDPDPIKGNDYFVTEIKAMVEQHEAMNYLNIGDSSLSNYDMVFITYNKGKSYAEVFARELAFVPI